MWRILAVIAAAVSILVAPAPPVRAQDAATDPAASVAASYEAAIGEARSNMMGNPVSAYDHAQQAETLAHDFTDDEERQTALATAWWLQSEALTRLGRPHEAYPVAQRAFEQLDQDATPTKLYADILLSLGRINQLTGDHGGALETFQKAYDVYRAIGETRSEAIVLQSIGSIYNDARQFQRAVDYYTDASQRYRGDSALDLAALNNLGNAYKELGRYDDALSHYRRALSIAEAMGSIMLQARILNNIGSLEVTFEHYDLAEDAIDEAFERVGDGATAEWARFLWGVRAQAAYGRGEHQLAREHIERTFDGMAIEQTPHHFTDFHNAAADIYVALGDWRAAVPHLRAFKRLEDEGRETAVSANSALLGAQFDFAEQELQIEQLRATGLERDLDLSRARANQRLVIAAGMFLLSVLAIIGVILRHRAARERQSVLERALYEDAETGLPSRPALERALQRLGQSLGRPATLVALEVERHTHLESALGFAKLAELKAHMAQRLVDAQVGECVTLVSPGVLGVVLTTDDAERALEAAEHLRACFTRPVQLDDLEIDVAVVVGVASHAHPETCVKNAIIAIEQAKEARVTAMVFDPKRYGDPSKNLTLMSRMLTATGNGDMAIHYQPKLNLRTGRFMAAEALCRWNDPETGFIAPDAFIPLAEETGHIRAFTEWALERTVRDQRKLLDSGFDICLAVNMSGALLADTQFAELARRIVEQAPGEIAFEVTETAMMQDPERAMANLEKWAAAGIRLAIDDYGSGLSSLAYLKTLPSRELKLDRAFVTNVEASNRDRMVVKSTVDLAHNLGLELTAEGVETPEGLALVKLLGCDWAQGFVLSKALPLDELIAFLERMQAEQPQSPRSSGTPPTHWRSL